MLQERQHRWSEIEELCDFTVVTDSLFTNLPKKTRRSSLQRALADVTSLTLSSPLASKINEDIMGEIVESSPSPSNSSHRKPSRDGSIDSTNTGSSSSSVASRQASIVSNVSSTTNVSQQLHHDKGDTQSLKERTIEQQPQPQKRASVVSTNGSVVSASTSQYSMRRISSEKNGLSSENVNARPVEKRLHRVNTEPVGISRRALTNALKNDRQRDSGDFKRKSMQFKSSDIKDRLSDSSNNSNNSSSNKIFTTQSEENISTVRCVSNYSLDGFEDDDDNEDDDMSLRTAADHVNDGDHISDSSMTSSVSTTSTTKKKKKGMQGLKKIFHRKQKEETK